MTYFVYVILLENKVLQSRKFQNKNPDLNPNLSCFYIGQSSNPPETRFWQHKKGYKSNRFARIYGLGLCPQYYEQINPIKTRKKALQLESNLTETLRAKGHGVWSN